MIKSLWIFTIPSELSGTLHPPSLTDYHHPRWWLASRTHCNSFFPTLTSICSYNISPSLTPLNSQVISSLNSTWTTTPFSSRLNYLYVFLHSSLFYFLPPFQNHLLTSYKDFYKTLPEKSRAFSYHKYIFKWLLGSRFKCGPHTTNPSYVVTWNFSSSFKVAILTFQCSY